MTINDEVWKTLFKKYNILEEIEDVGYYNISSKTIKEFREPRLATKFDHYNSLPNNFRKHKINILPTTRGTYILGKFNAYKRFPDTDEQLKNKSRKNLIKIRFPNFIESINPKKITSEAIAINTAYSSGILKDFLEEEKLMPTISGRMGSSNFTFDINNKKLNNKLSITIEKAQIEIDGGYEGQNSLSLIEAKKNVSKDFLVRQLYFPYRLWNKSINKSVRPIFLIHSNEIFSLYEYAFIDPNNYNSLKLIKQKNYVIDNNIITLDDINKLIDKSITIDEPKNVPSPQADDFFKVINLCELVSEEPKDRFEIANYFGFSVRQSGYYFNACKYLGLAQKKYLDGTKVVYLTQLGCKMLNLNYIDRQLFLAKLILKHRPFLEFTKDILKYNEVPHKKRAIKYMKKYEMNLDFEVAETVNRRASTIISWSRWIVDLIE